MPPVRGRYGRLTSKEQFEQRKLDMKAHTDMINDMVNQFTIDEKNHIDQIVRDIISENTKLTGKDGFYWNGRVLSNVQTQKGLGTMHLQKAPIHPSLKDKMLEAQSFWDRLTADKKKLTQGLAVLLRNANGKQEVRDALPELAVKMLDGGRLLSLPRTQPELYTLTSPLHRKQFKETEELMYFYLASRIITG